MSAKGCVRRSCKQVYHDRSASKLLSASLLNTISQSLAVREAKWSNRITSSVSNWRTELEMIRKITCLTWLD